jgi:hypothetical protein
MKIVVSDNFGQWIFTPLLREAELEQLLDLICKFDIKIFKYGGNEPLNEFLIAVIWSKWRRGSGLLKTHIGQAVMAWLAFFEIDWIRAV